MSRPLTENDIELLSTRQFGPQWDVRLVNDPNTVVARVTHKMFGEYIVTLIDESGADVEDKEVAAQQNVDPSGYAMDPSAQDLGGLVVGDHAPPWNLIALANHHQSPIPPGAFALHLLERIRLEHLRTEEIRNRPGLNPFRAGLGPYHVAGLQFTFGSPAA